MLIINFASVQSGIIPIQMTVTIKAATIKIQIFFKKFNVFNLYVNLDFFFQVEVFFIDQIYFSHTSGTHHCNLQQYY